VTRRARSSLAPLLLAWAGLGIACSQASAEPLPVVATFSILGDMVKRIGGERVAVTILVGPDGDTHVYQPTPADARAVRAARVLVVNGLGFEGWLDRLVEASGFDGLRVTATDGVDVIEIADKEDGRPRREHGSARRESGTDAHARRAGKHEEHEHHHGAYDPHAWQSLANAQVYVRNIATSLSTVDPAGAEHYDARMQAYLDDIRALDAEIRSRMDSLPGNRRTVVTSHDAFQYFGRDYGLTFLAPQGVSTESEASAKDVARLLEQIRRDGIRAVFVENLGDPRLIERIASEAGAVVGGTLYPGALSPPGGPAPTYLDLVRHNARTIHDALADR